MLKIKRFEIDPEKADLIKSLKKSSHLTYIHDGALYVAFKNLFSDSISVSLAFPEDYSKWNDFDYILVLDEDFGQPYYPFYCYMNDPYKTRLFPVLRQVVTNYNEFMESQPFLKEREEK